MPDQNGLTIHDIYPYDIGHNVAGVLGMTTRFTEKFGGKIDEVELPAPSGYYDPQWQCTVELLKRKWDLADPTTLDAAFRKRFNQEASVNIFPDTLPDPGSI